MMVSRNARLLAILSFFILVVLAYPHIRYYADYVRQTSPFSNQRQVEQPFTATRAELAGLHGRSRGKFVDNERKTEPIPNIVHFIYGLKNPIEHPGAGSFDFVNYLAVRSALVSINPDALYIHYTYLADPPSPDAGANPLTNPWIARLAKHPGVKLVHHEPTVSPTRYAHLSDTMRLEFLQSQGGIYLDIDVFALRPFDSIRHIQQPYSVVLGHEGGNRWGLCNAVIMARPNSTFISRWIDSYADVDFTREWNYHSVLLPKVMAEENPGEVCEAAPDAFFWPTWTWRHVEWMHEELKGEEARYWKRKIGEHGGSLSDDQVAYHAWNQMSYDRYLKALTPDIVRTKDTRFNLLVRRFVEDDLLLDGRRYKELELL